MSNLVPRFSLREPWERGWNGELSGQLLAPVWYSLLDPQRLPLGIPIKIAIIEKIESTRGTQRHKDASGEERGYGRLFVL